MAYFSQIRNPTASEAGMPASTYASYLLRLSCNYIQSPWCTIVSDAVGEDSSTPVALNTLFALLNTPIDLALSPRAGTCANREIECEHDHYCAILTYTFLHFRQKEYGMLSKAQAFNAGKAATPQHAPQNTQQPEQRDVAQRAHRNGQRRPFR